MEKRQVPIKEEINNNPKALIEQISETTYHRHLVDMETGEIIFPKVEPITDRYIKQENYDSNIDENPRSFLPLSEPNLNQDSKNDLPNFVGNVLQEVVENVVQKEELIQKMQLNFKCNICNAAFEDSRRLRNHKKLGHKHLATDPTFKWDPKPFDCKSCDAKFPLETSLKRHVTSVHEKINQCHICDRIFESALDLNKHLHRGHKQVDKKNPISYDCNSCEAKFQLEKNLKKHFISVHLKNHQCHFCDEIFESDVFLNKHLKKGHGEKKLKWKNMTPKKSQECKYCGEKFFNERIFKKHFNSCEGLKCQVCDKRFLQKDHLNEHIKGAHNGKSLKDLASKFC